METSPARVLLGTSGWSYPDWVGVFYPDGTRPDAFLREYARTLRTVEIDSTFYGIPREKTVRSWAEHTPPDFVFAAKVPQTITHDKQLMDCAADISAFVERMSLLEDKLGPLLLQFPYGFKADRFDVLAAFLPSLPADVAWALEVRHKSWLKPAFYDLLRSRGVALALIDHPWMPALDVATAPFTYIRWLGDRARIPDDFSRLRIDRTEDLRRWKAVVERLSTEGLVVHGYFNNHYEGFSPGSLERFERMLGGPADRMRE